MPYVSQWVYPVSISLAEIAVGAVYSKKSLVSGTFDNPLIDIRVSKVVFRECEFNVKWRYSSFTDCTFIACRFNWSHFDFVKFSKCRFERCNFSHVTLSHCNFVRECDFVSNSISAEEFHIASTSLPPRKFLEALTTNDKYLPNPSVGNVRYNRYKFAKSMQKIAQKIYTSVRNEEDLDQFVEAFRQVTIFELNWDMERRRYREVNPNPASEWKSGLLYWFDCIPSKVQYYIIYTSGFCTNWGYSLSRPMGLFAILAALFSVIYAFLVPDYAITSMASQNETIFRAIHVTLVAGYTAHWHEGDSFVLRFVTALNLVVGIFWYSLIVIVLTRRVMR